LAAEKTLARTLTTNLGTTTLYVCSPTPRKQASGQSTTAKKLLRQETLEEATAELLRSYQETLNSLAQKKLVKDVLSNNSVAEKMKIFRAMKEPPSRGKKKTKKRKKKEGKSGFVTLIDIRRSYSELFRDILQVKEKSSTKLFTSK